MNTLLLNKWNWLIRAKWDCIQPNGKVQSTLFVFNNKYKKIIYLVIYHLETLVFLNANLQVANWTDNYILANFTMLERLIKYELKYFVICLGKKAELSQEMKNILSHPCIVQV